MKVPSARLRHDSLSAHADRTRYPESEAGNRAQPDVRCGMTLALKGNSHGETEPKKATYVKAGHNTKTPTTLEPIPAVHKSSNGKSPGNPMVEVATPNGTTNLSEGTNKNELWV